MFDQNADESRARSEQSKKILAFNELIESVLYEITDSSKYGGRQATYKVSDGCLEFLDALKENLTERGYGISFDSTSNKLTITW